MDRLQREFHEKADQKRFRNRLDNPFIRPKEKKLAARIAQEMSANGKTILEIGCGEGNNLAYLRQQLPGVELVGMDFSFSKTRFLKHAAEHTKPVCGDAAALPFAPNLFDLVLCRDLLHHVPTRKHEVVTEACRVLKPDGAAVFIESRGDTLLNKVFSALIPAEKHMKDNTREMLLDLAGPYTTHSVCFVEASQLVRACSYFFGWPRGISRLPVGLLLSVATIWEFLYARLAPREKWSTLMLIIRKPGV
jgi:ubiquinone/menaquinone biosynthesis C-methylase UbiE